ncbi:CCT motif family protein [Striga asiatica]|uniref:CCT motif family protein n=1 Tax=Striga asiatica TaxID=4170 RepID=A0A5A7R0E0_STRAF|nr:CCT motif family protein [Striga asiatica]
MYGQNNNNESLFPYNYSPELIQAQFPLILPPLAIPDSLYTSSGCSSYGGSPTSRASCYSPTIIPHTIDESTSFSKPGDIFQYECRKTLADSRPRIRGRFARNDETEKTGQSQWEQSGVDEDDEDEANWINLLDAFSANMIP